MFICLIPAFLWDILGSTELKSYCTASKEDALMYAQQRPVYMCIIISLCCRYCGYLALLCIIGTKLTVWDFWFFLVNKTIYFLVSRRPRAEWFNTGTHLYVCKHFNICVLQNIKWYFVGCVTNAIPYSFVFWQLNKINLYF